MQTESHRKCLNLTCGWCLRFRFTVIIDAFEQLVGLVSKRETATNHTKPASKWTQQSPLIGDQPSYLSLILIEARLSYFCARGLAFAE